MPLNPSFSRIVCYFLHSTSQDFARNPLTRSARLYYHQKCTHIWSRIDGSGQLSSRGLARGSRNNTLKAITDKIKVNDSIVDRVGGYNFSPTLILSGPRRRQCPLYSVNSESSLLDCAGNDRYSKDWSPSFFEGSATQAKRLCQSRYGPVESSWTRTMSNPISLHGKDDGVSRGPTR